MSFKLSSHFYSDIKNPSHSKNISIMINIYQFDYNAIIFVNMHLISGFAANELASRIDHAKSKVIIAASCGLEPSKVIK